MLDLSHIDKLAPTDTYDHVLHPQFRLPADGEKPVVLILRYAGRGSEYMKALSKLPALTDEKQASERAARLFAKLAVVGWKNVHNVDGGDAPFDAKACGDMLARFVNANREDVIDRAIGIGLDRDYFHAPIVKAADLGKE